jgi:hypothetical protein
MARILAILKRTRRIPDDILYAGFVLEQMSNNPVFASPPVPYADLAAKIAALQAAEAYTLTGTHGAAAARNAQFVQVWSRLEQLKSYVQGLADQSLESAAVIIETAGMNVKKSSGHGRALFKVVPGPNPGTVKVFGAREKTRASYEWQYSLDGITWLTGAWTVKASAVITGLEQGKKYLFRFRTATSAGMSNFSQVLTLVLQ